MAAPIHEDGWLDVPSLSWEVDRVQKKALSPRWSIYHVKAKDTPKWGTISKWPVIC